MAQLHLDHQAGVMRIEPREQCRHFRPEDMRGDAETETATRIAQRRERAVMRREEGAGFVEEHRALRGQAHEPRRPLDQPVAETLFQPLQPEADGSLVTAQSRGGAGEAAQLRSRNESSDGIDVECHGTSHINSSSLK